MLKMPCLWVQIIVIVAMIQGGGGEVSDGSRLAVYRTLSYLSTIVGHVCYLDHHASVFLLLYFLRVSAFYLYIIYILYSLAFAFVLSFCLIFL